MQIDKTKDRLLAHCNPSETLRDADNMLDRETIVCSSGPVNGLEKPRSNLWKGLYKKKH